MHRNRRYLASVLAVLAVLLAPAPSWGAWEHYTTADADYPTKVDFVQVCDVVKTGYFDPIKWPGQSNVTHQHTFSGNLDISPTSTISGNVGDATNCGLSHNGSAYWMPSVKADGVVIAPDNTNPGGAVRVYYRAGSWNAPSLNPVPPIQMIAGNSDAQSPQSAGVAGWHCRDAGGAVTSKQSTPPACPINSYLEASVVFPNCWDGVNVTSADQSHVAYANASTKTCNASTHPYQFPQITIAERFAYNATYGKTVTVATKTGTNNHPTYGLHADWQWGWDTDWMDWLTQECIHAEIGCEGIRDNRLPPNPSEPPPA